MLLYLLRHGDAIEFGFEDSERPLSALGERQSRIAGRYLKQAGLVPSLIMSSPLKRAMRTAALVSEETGTADIVPTEQLIPGLGEKELFDEINARALPSVLLVGHEPQLRKFILRLTGDSGLQIALRKGTLVCVECREPVARGSGTLRWLLTNEEMEERGASHSLSSG
jgi:phosphohistidine phosphatase